MTPEEIFTLRSTTSPIEKAFGPYDKDKIIYGVDFEDSTGKTHTYSAGGIKQEREYQTFLCGIKLGLFFSTLMNNGFTLK